MVSNEAKRSHFHYILSYNSIPCCLADNDALKICNFAENCRKMHFGWCSTLHEGQGSLRMLIHLFSCILCTTFIRVYITSHMHQIRIEYVSNMHQIGVYASVNCLGLHGVWNSNLKPWTFCGWKGFVIWLLFFELHDLYSLNNEIKILYLFTKRS